MLLMSCSFLGEILGFLGSENFGIVRPRRNLTLLTPPTPDFRSPAAPQDCTFQRCEKTSG